MDALTRRQFDRAMFAKERTLAIRVGEYASRDIKEASFEYGYIKGDTYKPGGTCAGSGKITFTSIITTFNKLDTLHPEIGLLVGDTYQWVKMGEYFINDIEIDRNRNTTTLELMDGMFKLNREYVTDLHFPAEVREVIQEICLKTGIELANDYFGISAMRYHIEQVPEGKKLSFRDMLSAMTQVIGMSCFFNREGKMEIRDLTESNITINADSYFLHGLTKSEIEYQIAGITCKTDKKSLTVGMKTGRSLELDNVFMTQSALNDLYYKLKNLTYYPYNLNYQGHLLLEVGQWVTIQTNKKETFKVPVLSQSFTFKGGLRGRISADSKAGNDTQYSYEGTITKQIKQQDGIEAKIQAQIEAADAAFDAEFDKREKAITDAIELAKARAEEVKRELSDTINQRFNSFDNGPLKETKRKAEEALRNAGASTLLAQEAKRIGLDSVARLEAFKSQTTSAQTALSGDLDALKRTIANDIRPKQAQAEAEIAKQVEALSRTKNELDGASTLLAQEAKRIELDSVARLEAFKSQTTSAQTALSGDLDVLKRTIANDIRPKQAQAEAEIAKQVKALSRTKNELSGVKSAQATYEETTTRRLSELTNLANGKASKSELTQTAEELASRIASVQAGSSRNYFRNSRSRTFTTGGQAVYDYRTFIVPDFWKNSDRFKRDYVRISFDVTFPVALVNDMPAMVHFSAHPWYAYRNLIFKGGTVERQHFEFTIDLSSSSEDYQTNNVFIRFGTNYGFPAGLQVVIENAMLSVGNYFPAYQPAYEDQEDRVSVVESNFKQRADSLDAGVSRLTEGFRTKADISSLNVTAENIRQSVKSLETDTQNKLNQKLSQAEFEVRAGSIRQEILNATKDKASKSELTQTAEELASRIASVHLGRRNLLKGTKELARYKPVSEYNGFKVIRTVAGATRYQDSYVERTVIPTAGTEYIAIFYARASENDYPVRCHFYNPNTVVSSENSSGYKSRSSDGLSIIRLSTDWQLCWVKWTQTATDQAKTVIIGRHGPQVGGKEGVWVEICAPAIFEGNLAGDWSPAYEDQEDRVSVVESNFKQRADSLDAGVSRLTEGFRTKADISSLNVTAENIRQSVKSLETDTQNKLNQKLSQAEFEVRAGSIRQEILNATKDKASKSELTQTAQGLRTDLSAIQEYVNKNGQRQEALQRYTREESTRQATAVRELVNRDFVGKATYQEDVKGINQRIEAVKTSANKDIASQIASYRQSVDGKFTDISSQITTYKQDVGGQISGLSNRLTSSEQGTTTQISNISNRINSNKQGADNQISNLKTQVATNKDNAERQMGRISDQVSANKANADSQFANVTNQLARKVETTDFQRVKETSKLYERILGNTENGIADKVARMALTNQLFQVEVGKYSVSGPNLIKNSDFKNGTNEWGSTQNLGRLVKHSFYHNGQKDLMRLSNATKNENFLYSHRFNLERNTDYVLNFRGFNNSALASYDVYILGRRAGESDGFTIVKKVVSSKKLSTSRCEDVSVTFNSGEMDNAYIRFDNNGSSSGTADLYITEVDLYKGYKPRTWQPHPEDAVADANKKLEATQTKMTQLAGSWVVENINSAGDIISGINLGANGHNRFVGKLTHITGETLIDRAVIKSAMVDKLKTGNFEAGSVTTTILDAEAVTAEKLKVDDALIRKLTANDAFIDQLISKRIFSIKVESVISSSTFLEAYQGRIGGFTLGQFDQGGGRWISGVNQFSVGMGNGAGYGVRTAFWANWGNNWNYAGPKAWNVNTDGKMYCRNEVGFYDQVDFSNSSRANFYGNTTFSRSPVFSNGIELGSKDVLGDGWNPKGGRNAVVWWNQVGSGSLKYWMEQKSDRRLKENITDTAVKALDKINRLRMVAFDFIENKKHEEIGLIAQEAETIVPKIVSRDPENPDGYLHIDYTALVPYLIKAIQELNQKIEKMEKTIA
ncbi:TPA: tail fiber domain-containing protein [Streptococcus pneumoniae]